MESHNIEQLLDRYFEGETSLNDEEVLRSYFAGEHVAGHLQQYCSMFLALGESQLKTYDRPIVLPAIVSFPYKCIIGTAAAVILGTFLWTQQVQVDDSFKTTYESEELAVLKTKQAFGVISQMITSSTTQLEVVREFDKASSTLFK